MIDGEQPNKLLEQHEEDRKPEEPGALVPPELAGEWIVVGVLTLSSLFLLWILGLPLAWEIALIPLLLLIIGGISWLWRRDRFRGLVQPQARLLLTLLLVSLVLSWILSTALLQNRATPTQVCDQINITALPDSVDMGTPAEDGSVYKEITYDLKPPPDTGVRVIFHSYEIVFYKDNGQVVSLANDYDHIHLDAHTGPGQLMRFKGAILFVKNLQDTAKANGSNQLTERQTFHMVTDQKIYCTKLVEVHGNIK